MRARLLKRHGSKARCCCSCSCSQHAQDINRCSVPRCARTRKREKQPAAKSSRHACTQPPWPDINRGHVAAANVLGTAAAPHPHPNSHPTPVSELTSPPCPSPVLACTNHAYASILCCKCACTRDGAAGCVLCRKPRCCASTGAGCMPVVMRRQQDSLRVLC